MPLANRPKPKSVFARPLTRRFPRGREALWRQMGCPDFRDEEIWLEAERELKRSPSPPQVDSSDEGPEERMEELEARLSDPSTRRETTSL